MAYVNCAKLFFVANSPGNKPLSKTSVNPKSGRTVSIERKFQVESRKSNILFVCCRREQIARVKIGKCALVEKGTIDNNYTSCSNATISLRMVRGTPEIQLFRARVLSFRIFVRFTLHEWQKTHKTFGCSRLNDWVFGLNDECVTTADLDETN